MKRLNHILAKRVTLIFGTMWMCYAFFIYGLLPLVPALQPYQNMLMYWSTWVQLWALPLLMVGQNVLGEAAEKREQETHDAVMQELAFVKEELALAKEERDMMQSMLKLVHKEHQEAHKLVKAFLLSDKTRRST